jgi:phage tail sheath gpL-like
VPHYIADTLEARIQSRFSGMKLADDYTEPSDTPPGVVTPRMAKDVIYEVLKEAEADAIVSEITAAIKAQIDAEVDSSIDGRLNYECPVPSIDGAYVIAGNVRGF